MENMEDRHLHAFSKCLLSPCCVPGSCWVAEHTPVCPVRASHPAHEAQEAQEEEQPPGLRDGRWERKSRGSTAAPPPTAASEGDHRLVKFQGGPGQLRLRPQKFGHRDKHTERVARGRQRPGRHLQARNQRRPASQHLG